MAEKKLNCWEYHNCGRGPGGKKISTLGLCPAAYDESYNGINSGVNGGRICWAVAGTLCGGKTRGTFAEKRNSCLNCDFFTLVRKEEGDPNKQNKFLKYIVDTQGNPFISGLTHRHVVAGERFITQGEPGDTAYIIQKGTCLVIVEKDGNLHPVNHYGKGDIVGGIGLLTGEPRIAHVEAETDMDLWVLNKKQFDHISAKDPALMSFLTELVADRFDSKRPTAYRRIGKYLTTDIIGRGGYSIVYKGVHAGLNLPVAIKMLRYDMALDQDFMNGFYGEAKTIAGMEHENIVRIYDIEERYKTLFIIMELITGESLRDLIDQLKTLSPRLTVKFLLQICAGLAYAHKHGIVHRDINPSNIIIKRYDRLKIIDFGLTCVIGTEDFHSQGTLFYKSPEQIEGDPVGPYTDIYALGITTYEMLTGRRPFPENNLWELRNIHLKDDIPDPAEIVSDIPEDLRKFIMKAGRCDPSRRYRDISQALDDLHNLAEEYGLLHQRSSNKQKQKMTNICLMYNADRQIELNKLIEEFSNQAQKIGAALKVAAFYDI